MIKRSLTILNGRFDALRADQTVTAVFEALKGGVRGWLCTVNVATLMRMRENPALQSFVDRALVVVADGQPLVWCAPLFGGHLPERVAGIELIDALCERAAVEGEPVYLLGATPALIAGSRLALTAKYPTLEVHCSDGYFPHHEAVARADAIRASNARLLFVGMGTPRQESFIEEHWERLGVAVAIGVGGSFDVLGGARFRAHRWLRKAGFEWFVRLVQEPIRLFPRYLVTNSLFCALIVRAAFARLKRPA